MSDSWQKLAELIVLAEASATHRRLQGQRHDWVRSRGLIASARLHKLDPEVYLRDVFRVLPFWPRQRFLELAPRYWRITRARLDRVELDREVGWLTIPDSPLPTMLSVHAVTAPAPVAM